ncbi:nephrocystin-4 isoform X1 [Lepisosteus oculatus]|uniref:nephrocystin-4 isoform X1 n=1 Tax=Lepisosteus oculatus TaxID=7918 RepID=UPI00370FF649
MTIGMTAWKERFEKSQVIPPHCQRTRLAQENSEGFQIILQHLEGMPVRQRLLEGLQGVQYQLRVSLFDITHRHVFGRTWRSSEQQMKTPQGQPYRVSFNEVLYFHTSLRHPSVVAIVEVVAVVPKADSSHQALGCGFGILRLFSSQTEPGETSAAKQDKRLNLYHGTPRVLLHPALHDPFEQNSYVKVIQGAHVRYSLQSHPAMETILHLLPQNILVSRTEDIPGVAPASDNSGDCLRKPRLLKSFTCYLDKLSVILHPSTEKFEEDLLQLLNIDRLNRENSGPDGNEVVVLERRLHVGIHNGWGFLHRPQVVVLDPEPEEARGGTGSFRGRQGSLTKLSSSVRHALVLRSYLPLKGMVNHPAFGIVFQLEYVFSAPVGGEGKASSTTLFSHTAFMQCLRWAVWSPFVEPGSGANSEVSLALQGGSEPNPSGVMVYRAPSTGMSSAEMEEVEGGTLRFRFSVRTDGREPSPIRSVGSGLDEVSRQRKPPSPSRRRSASQPHTSPPRSPQGSGMSMSRISMSPRYPTISHSTASPWQQQIPCQLLPSPIAAAYQLSHAELPFASSIAHLEADLSLPAPQPQSPSAEQLQELPFTPVHAPIVALGTQMPSAQISRGALALLHSVGFPDVRDCNSQVAEVVDPSDPVNFDPQREEADFFQYNEIILQFLAFSRVPEVGVKSDWPHSVYFTFQLYRFPPVSTQRLQLLDVDGSQRTSREPAPCVLAVINKDGIINSESPGLQLKYLLDPGFLKPGEKQWFLRYLAIHTLHIDVWDAESLLLIGSSAVELKHLLRQGRPAVQVMHELEVITTDYFQDSMALSSNISQHGSIKPVEVSTVVRGRLHLRLGNIGHHVNLKARRTGTLPPSQSRVVSAHDGTSGFAGGSLSSKSLCSLNGQNGCHFEIKNSSRAQRLVDTDSELAALLHSRMKEASIALRHADPELDEIRQRKLERMMEVRRYEREGQISETKPYTMTRREERVQHSQDLQIIEAYRERSKVESITNMLSKAITIQHIVYATLGTAEFFEFALKNPFNVQQTITIECEDKELSVIVDSREWRHFKDLTKTLTPLEDDMFHLQENSLKLQVYLRPNETVHIPFKYQTFTADHTATMQGPTDARLNRSANVTQNQQAKTVQPKIIKVTFRAEDSKPLALCQVNVEPTPHVIDQTFRFYQPELSFLKKSIRLPPWHTVPGLTVGGQGGEPQVYVRCSDPNIICDTKKMAPGEPQDVFLKVAVGPSPQIKKFFVMIYTDPWLAVPVQIWQLYVHSLQRVDVSCLTGQLTGLSLVLRGTQAVRKVKCYTSHPHELQIDPAEVFVLPPNAVQDLQIGVRPQRAGSKFIYLNVVDVEFHQLVASWLVCVSCKQPFISKAFEISLPVGGGKGSNKKITYTNPYPSQRAFFLHTNRPDLLQFKEDTFETGAGEVYTIGLRFAPSQSAGVEEILIFINDQQDKNEETFCVKVVYQ